MAFGWQEQERKKLFNEILKQVAKSQNLPESITEDALNRLPKIKKDKVHKIIKERMMDPTRYGSEIKIAMNYLKFQQAQFAKYKKEKNVDKDIKSPLQLPKKQRSEFFALVKKEWKKQKTASYKTATIPMPEMSNCELAELREKPCFKNLMKELIKQHGK